MKKTTLLDYIKGHLFRQHTGDMPRDCDVYCITYAWHFLHTICKHNNVIGRGIYNSLSIICFRVLAVVNIDCKAFWLLPFLDSLMYKSLKVWIVFWLERTRIELLEALIGDSSFQYLLVWFDLCNIIQFLSSMLASFIQHLLQLFFLL